MSLKKGDILYKVWLMPHYLTTVCEEWHVTNVDRRGAFLTRKVKGVTWGKLSKKNGHYGFLPSIDSMYRDRIPEGENYKDSDYHKTETAALRALLPALKTKAKKLNAAIKRLEKQIKK